MAIDISNQIQEIENAYEGREFRKAVVAALEALVEQLKAQGSD